MKDASEFEEHKKVAVEKILSDYSESISNLEPELADSLVGELEQILSAPCLRIDKVYVNKNEVYPLTEILDMTVEEFEKGLSRRMPRVDDFEFYSLKMYLVNVKSLLKEKKPKKEITMRDIFQFPIDEALKLKFDDEVLGFYFYTGNKYPSDEEIVNTTSKYFERYLGIKLGEKQI